jgi:tetratricopeptide (TPR) repeat protein
MKKKEISQDTPPANAPNSATDRNFISFVSALILILIILFIGGFVALWMYLPIVRPPIIVLAIGISFLGIYPLTYVAYHAFREKAHRKRLKDDFRLLGLVSEDELDETVDNLFLTVYNPTQFFVYIFLIIIFSTVIITAIFSQVDLKIVEKRALELAFFSFLGAYIFSIQELVRRYNTFDIRPQVFSSIFMRMVVATIIAFVGSSVISISAGQLVDQVESNSSTSSAWIMILAFVIGIFPSRGIRWFTQRTNGLLGSAIDLASQRSLEKIIGISTWHEARLSEMGIDDAQNLATADIRRLLLTTQFDTQEIIHWIDQSILYVKVGEKFDRFRDVKIASFSELRTVVQNLSLYSLKELDSETIKSRAEARKRLTSVLGLSDPDELERLSDYSNYPNYIHIAEYYSRTATVARQRANVAMDILLGALDETDFEDAIEDGERLLIQNPNDPTLLLRLGTAYYQVGRLDAAYNAYTKAIQQNPKLAEAYHSRSVVLADKGEFEKAIRDATDSISINPTSTRAYNNRGFAYMQMGYFDRALDDLNKALELDDRFAIAYFNRGIVYNSIGDFSKANKDFETTYLLGYRSAGLWVSWGNSLLGLENFNDAVVKLSQAVLYDADLATAFSKRGYAYLQLGSKYDYQARKDLETSIRLNSDILSAYVNLGLLEARNNNFQEAIKYYNKALTINENHFPTRYNLALAYVKQGNLINADKEFDRIIKLAPSNSFEYKEASSYLASHSQPEKAQIIES